MADDPLFQLAATTLSQLRAAAERTHDAATAIAKAFAESRLTPVQIVEGCELLGVPLNAYAVRALVGALADASAHIPAERLIRAIFEAPLPPPTQTAEPSEAAPSPPEVSALPLAQPQDAEQGREGLGSVEGESRADREEGTGGRGRGGRGRGERGGRGGRGGRR